MKSKRFPLLAQMTVIALIGVVVALAARSYIAKSADKVAMLAPASTQQG